MEELRSEDKAAYLASFRLAHTFTKRMAFHRFNEVFEFIISSVRSSIPEARIRSAGADCIEGLILTRLSGLVQCRQAFKDLLQNLIQWVDKMAGRMPVEKILDAMLR